MHKMSLVLIMLEVDSILSKCLEIAYKITAKVVECSDELTYS